MMKLMITFSEEWYDWSIDDVKAMIDKESDNKIAYIEYQYYQLGKDEKWFRKLCGILNGSKPKIKREIFLQRLRGSSDSPFEIEDLEALQELEKQPIESIYIDKTYRIDIYERLKKDIPYIVGVDVATGVGTDNTAVTILDPYTVKPVAEFASPYIGIRNLQNFLRVLVKKYIPKAILAVERNHNGEAVMDNLNCPI